MPTNTPIPRYANITPVRQPLQSELPRITTVHAPASGGPYVARAGALVKGDESVSEKPAYTSARFHVLRHIYTHYDWLARVAVVSEPVARAIIECGLHAPSLLAQLLRSMYACELPVYGQRSLQARTDVELPCRTLPAASPPATTHPHNHEPARPAQAKSLCPQAAQIVVQTRFAVTVNGVVSRT